MKRLLTGLMALLASVVVLVQPVVAQPSPTQRLRGSVEAFDGGVLVIKERSGELLRLTLADSFAVNEVVPIELTANQADSFVGIASMP